MATIHRFGNMTAGGTSEILVSSRAYVEQSSQAQRSVQSTSANDTNGGSGAQSVRVTYLDSNYTLKTEDLLLNGTTKVNTIATDIRFIERFEVIKGTACVGAVKLMDGTGGGAVEFCGISAGTTEAFFCHHYVPAGYSATLTKWGAVVDLNCNFKLKGQARFDGNLVDTVVDLDNLTGLGILTAGRLSFERNTYIRFGEKTYIRVTAVPGVANLITRTWFDLTEVLL